MKIKAQKTVLILCIACLSICFGASFVEAQDDRPVLGRRPTSPSQPQPAPKGGNNKRRANRRAARGAEAAASPVPKGKTLEFYVLKGSELLDTGEYDLATLFFEEAEKRRKDRGVTPELLELLERQTRVTKLHIEAASLSDADVEKSLANYQEILKLRPNDQKAKEKIPVIYNKIAEDALTNKQYERAVELFAQLFALTPDNDEIRKKLVASLVGRGEAELKAGREEMAQTTYKRVLQLDPKNQQALDVVRRFDLQANLKFAEDKLAAGAYEDALTKFKEILSLDPNNEPAKRGLQLAQGNYQKLKAEQFYLNRKYLEAERQYKEASAILSEDEQIKRRLDELTLRLGPPLPLKGKLTWRGKIAGPLKVMIKGKELSYPEGEGVRAGGTISEALPDVPYVIKRIRRVTGSAMVRISDQPATTNGYATVVALNPKDSTAEDVSFEIEWELKRQGRVVWNGRVTGRSLIRVQGPFIDIEQISGEEAKDVKYQLDGLPHQDTLVKVRKVSGKPEIRLMESPSEANLYIATIAVESPSDTSSEALSFELEWQLK